MEGLQEVLELRAKRIISSIEFLPVYVHYLEGGSIAFLRFSKGSVTQKKGLKRLNFNTCVSIALSRYR